MSRLRCRIGWHDFVPGETCAGSVPIPSRVCSGCGRIESTLYTGKWHEMTHAKPGFRTLGQLIADDLRERIQGRERGSQPDPD